VLAVVALTAAEILAGLGGAAIAAAAMAVRGAG
jgi:hypothetical protein